MSSCVIKYLDEGSMTAIITTATTYANNIQPLVVKVTKEQKPGVRTMADGREGYVRTVLRIATLYADSLSRSDNPKDLEQALSYDASLEMAKKALLHLFEQVDDTHWGNSADIMTIADRYVTTLQSQRAHNGALDLALEEIDEYNKRFGGGTEPKTNP